MKYNIKNEMMDLLKIQEQKPVEAYIGPFTFEKVNEILIETKAFLNQNEPDRLKSKRVYSVLVETMENVLKHAKKDPENSEAALLIYREDEKYLVYVGNFVEKEDASSFKKRIEYLMDKTPEQLKELKMQQLKEGTISEKGGAGLGLIDIVMKGSNSLNCEVKLLQKDDCLFVLIISVI